MAGLGCIGGVGYTPNFLRKQIAEIKKNLASPDLPFGIDLLLPQVGGNARKTNYDYTEGNLPELIDIIIESGAKLFISAVGVPPVWAVEKLHKNNILVMNMIGAPKHAPKAIAAGCDIICAQGGEGGGHTGEVATSILIPAVVDICKGHKSKLTGEPIYVVAAGGIADDCGYHDTLRTTIFTGRPMRVIKNPYILDWEQNRQEEMKKLLASGVIPYKADADKVEDPSPEQMKQMLDARPWLMGQVAGSIKEVKPAKEIMDEMTAEAVKVNIA
ncbi:hypothetical protein HDV03_001175 [Kappamyces sp. JEL0829]|nr:hypothetical protein HDV03_001175 [Kappamyces sp. JEL0829]